jgi:hypothetical protein
MEPFVVILTLLAVGMLLRRVPALPGTTGNVLNGIVIWVSLPALILQRIPELAAAQNMIVPALFPWVMLGLSAVLVFALSRLLTWDRATTGCLLLVIPLGNTSFLGIPMVQAFFGDGAIPYALLYDQLGSFLALATYGSIVVAVYGADGTRPTASGIAKRIVTFPPFVALVLALVLRPFAMPSVLSRLLELLAATLVPLVMIAVGFRLTLKLNRELSARLGIGLAIKLVAAPLAALWGCRLLGIEGLPVQVSIFEAGMPPMVTAAVLAISAGLAPTLTSALVGFGIVASFGTLPLLVRLIS